MKKSSLLVWILIGIIIVGGLGTIIYFNWPKKTEQKEQTFEEKLSEINAQLAEIKTVLNKPENSSKKVQYSVQLADLENQINNLPQEFSKKEEIINQLQTKIKEICQDLGIKDKDPEPLPDPNEKWETKKIKLYRKVNNEILTLDRHPVITQRINSFDWLTKLKQSSNEVEFNKIKQEALKDIKETRLLYPQERLKLKDYFVIWIRNEIGKDWIDGSWNTRNMKDALIPDLNQAIKVNPKSTWQRKYMAFTGEFGIKDEWSGNFFDNDNEYYKPIVIKKTHNPDQYNGESNVFYLRKGEPDFHLFKNCKEAINFLRQNDSYFK